MKRVLLFGVVGMVGLCACTTPRIFHWGAYEDQIYTRWNKQGEFAAQEQFDQLEKEVQIMQSRGTRPHPGFHAYRGQLLLELGRESEAAAEFETESKLFPESATFMKRFMKLGKKVSSASVGQY